jgi:hypothetical protein
MVGTMADDADWKRVVRGHGEKGRHHEAKTIIGDARWQTLP